MAYIDYKFIDSKEFNELDSSFQIVYFFVITHNYYGICRYRLSTIAERKKLTVRTVQRAIKHLEEMGVLKRELREGREIIVDLKFFESLERGKNETQNAQPSDPQIALCDPQIVPGDPQIALMRSTDRIEDEKNEFINKIQQASTEFEFLPNNIPLAIYRNIITNNNRAESEADFDKDVVVFLKKYEVKNREPEINANILTGLKEKFGESSVNIVIAGINTKEDVKTSTGTIIDAFKNSYLPLSKEAKVAFQKKIKNMEAAASQEKRYQEEQERKNLEEQERERQEIEYRGMDKLISELPENERCELIAAARDQAISEVKPNDLVSEDSIFYQAIINQKARIIYREKYPEKITASGI